MLAAAWWALGAIAERIGQAVEKAYRIEQLSDAINSYMEMRGFVSHELKSPLASIITLAKTFRDGYFGEISAEHRGIVDCIAAGQAAAAGRLLHDHVMASRERMHRKTGSPLPAPKSRRTRRSA